MFPKDHLQLNTGLQEVDQSPLQMTRKLPAQVEPEQDAGWALHLARLISGS